MMAAHLLTCATVGEIEQLMLRVEALDQSQQSSARPPIPEGGGRQLLSQDSTSAVESWAHSGILSAPHDRHPQPQEA